MFSRVLRSLRSTETLVCESLCGFLYLIFVFCEFLRWIFVDVFVHLVVYCRSRTLNPESVIWNLYLLSDILLCCFVANNLESSSSSHLVRLTVSCDWEHSCFFIIQWVLCFLILEKNGWFSGHVVIWFGAFADILLDLTTETLWNRNCAFIAMEL